MRHAGNEPRAPKRRAEFLRRYAPFNRMTDAALAFLVPRLQLVHFAKDEKILATQSGPVGPPAHRAARDSSAAGPTTRRRIRTARSAPASCFPSARCRPAARRPRSSTRSRTPTATCFRAHDFLELRQASPEFERYCTQAITETLKQSLESLHSQYSQRVAEQQTADPYAGRARPQSRRSPAPPRPPCARRRRRWPTRRCARSSRSIPTGRRSACSRWSICCERVVLPGLSLDVPLAETMSSPDRRLARVGDRLRSDARDGRARHPAGRGRGERPALRRGQRARSLRAAAGVDAAGQRGPARRRQRRQA